MDFARASRTPHAAGRLLAGAVLVALLALAPAVSTARAAHVVAPPTAAPEQVVPQTPVDERGSDDEPDRPHDHAPAQPRPQLPIGDGVFGDDATGLEFPTEDELPAVTSTYVRGKVARMRTDGRAAIPRGVPKRVRALIAQYNRIAGKRYKWGGGHAKLADVGYDCSGAVGYGLIKGGLLRTTMVSGSFARWGAAGAGRWVTVYAHKSHVYIEVAGLRLDTSSIGDASARSGVRWRPAIGQRHGFKARHPVGL